MVVVVIVLVIILHNEPITTDTITILTRHFIILTRKQKYALVLLPNAVKSLIMVHLTGFKCFDWDKKHHMRKHKNWVINFCQLNIVFCYPVAAQTVPNNKVWELLTFSRNLDTTFGGHIESRQSGCLKLGCGLWVPSGQERRSGNKDIWNSLLNDDDWFKWIIYKNMFYNSHQKPYDHRKHSSSLIALHFQGKFYVDDQ